METFRNVAGRKLIGRDAAENLGTIDHLVIDADHRRIAMLVVGHGRKARLVDWSALQSFGPDAVIVPDASALREPADERDGAAGSGDLNLLGKRVLSTAGNELGAVKDVSFDPADGSVHSLDLGADAVPAGALRGIGSYAAVVEQQAAAAS